MVASTITNSEFPGYAKELIVRAEDKFRRPEQSDGEFTYQLIGLAQNDTVSDFNVSVSCVVIDGN